MQPDRQQHSPVSVHQSYPKLHTFAVCTKYSNHCTCMLIKCRYIPAPVGTAAGAYSISCLPEVEGQIGKPNSLAATCKLEIHVSYM